MKDSISKEQVYELITRRVGEVDLICDLDINSVINYLDDKAIIYLDDGRVRYKDILISVVCLIDKLGIEIDNSLCDEIFNEIRERFNIRVKDLNHMRNQTVLLKNIKEEEEEAKAKANEPNWMKVAREEGMLKGLFAYNKEHPIVCSSGDIKTIKTYLMKDGSGYTKIGKSKNPNVRLKQLSTGNPSIVLLAVCESNIENTLHKEYNEYHTKGEWFKLSDEQISCIIKDHSFTLSI